MIKTKKELKEFISYEKKYYGKSRPYLFLPRLSESSIEWRYVCLLRYEEYHFNNHHKIRRIIFHYLRIKMSRFYKINMPLNVIDKGLRMRHPYNIMINAKRIGKNCSIQFGTQLVASGHDASNPTIGDDVVFGCCCTIVGNVELADGIAVGANSLVNKSFLEKDIAIAGNPAKKISNNGSKTWGKVQEK